MSSQIPLWQSQFTVPAGAVELFLDGLDEAALSVAAFETGPADGADWRVELIHQGEPDRETVAARLAPLAERAGLSRIAFTLAPVPMNDWLKHTAESFAPQQIGRFWVHGSHIQGQPPADLVPITLDAGLAFGSGEHASTSGCLLAIDRLARRRRFRRVLDLGCGSGILAIAAAKCWPAKVLATDIDPQAVEVAGTNAALNGVAHRVRTLRSDGYQARAIGAGGPYDLIVANILADPLCDLARATARHLAPGGRVVLAGLLDRQAQRVIDAHQRARLQLRAWLEVDMWTTLILSKRPG